MKLFQSLLSTIGFVILSSSSFAENQSPVAKALLSKYEIDQKVLSEKAATITYKTDLEIYDVKFLVNVNDNGKARAFEMIQNEEDQSFEIKNGLNSSTQAFRAVITFKVKDLNENFARGFSFTGFGTDSFEAKVQAGQASTAELDYTSFRDISGLSTLSSASTSSQSTSVSSEGNNGTSSIQAYAQQRANQMASRRFKGHLPGAVVTFGGVTYFEGTGWNSARGIMPNTCRGQGAPAAEAHADGPDGSYGVRFYTTPTRPSRRR